jgi:hypothetical protein
MHVLNVVGIDECMTRDECDYFYPLLFVTLSTIQLITV